jgi:hypothetical protein
MLNFKRKRYLLISLLVAVAIVVSSIQIVTAQLATSRVGDLVKGGALLPTGQVITPAAAPGSTFAPLATGLLMRLKLSQPLSAPMVKLS